MLNINKKQIKDNLPIIVIIPTLLGGLWQVLSLSNISISYIRFFSVSQVIPDGLLILLLLSIIYIFFKLFKPIKISSNTISIILGYSISILLLWFFYLSLNDKKTNYNLDYLLSHLLLLTLGIQYFIYSTNELVKRTIILKHINFSNSFFSLVLLFLSYWFFNKTFSFINNNFTYPKHLENVKNIDNIINLKYPNNKTYEIEYMNDKYIFIAITDSVEKKIDAVLEFNSLFNNCIKTDTIKHIHKEIINIGLKDKSEIKKDSLINTQN